jgi:hypothetical protein
MMVRITLKLWTNEMKKNGMPPVPPGEILNEEYLKPLGLTANALAKANRGAAQPDYGDSQESNRRHRRHGDSLPNVFQNVGGILDELANDPRTP